MQVGNEKSKNLRDLIEKMLKKNPEERISIKEIKSHAWVTMDGQDPVMSSQENCGMKISVTSEDIRKAFKPAWSFMHKVKHR